MCAYPTTTPTSSNNTHVQPVPDKIINRHLYKNVYEFISFLHCRFS